MLISTCVQRINWLIWKGGVWSRVSSAYSLHLNYFFWSQKGKFQKVASPWRMARLCWASELGAYKMLRCTCSHWSIVRLSVPFIMVSSLQLHPFQVPHHFYFRAGICNQVQHSRVLQDHFMGATQYQHCLACKYLHVKFARLTQKFQVVWCYGFFSDPWWSFKFFAIQKWFHRLYPSKKGWGEERETEQINKNWHFLRDVSSLK